MLAFPVNTWFHSLGTVFFLTFYLWHPPSNLDLKISFYGLLFTVSFLPLLYFFFYKPTCFWVASNCVNPPSQDASYLVKKIKIKIKKWAKCFFFIKILQKSISFLSSSEVKCPLNGYVRCCRLDSEDHPNLHQTSQSLILDM